MMGSRRATWTQAAAIVLAAGLLASARTAAGIDGLVPENGLRANWSPKREDAILVDSEPALRGANYDEPTAAAEALPVESPLRTSRLMQRPRSLSRPAPG